MFERILPPSVRVAESRLDTQVPLFPDEAAAISRAAAARRREFVTGRACARRALGELGVEPVGIPPGPGGAPAWPAGVVGSLTHCEGLRAAAVARASQWRSLGIDAEPRAPLPDEVASLVTSPQERRTLAVARADARTDARTDTGTGTGARTNTGSGARTGTGARSDARTDAAADIPWDTVLFSGKEAVYKAWYPLTGRFLDYPDIHLDVSADGSFTARLLVPGAVVGGMLLDRFEGRWLVADDLVATAVLVRA